jgi:hypothetical protein
MVGCYISSELIVPIFLQKVLRYQVLSRLIQLSYLWTVQKPGYKKCDENCKDYKVFG